MRALLAILALVAADCGGAGDHEPLLVFAAASLRAPFEVLARDFERQNPGTTVDLHTAGTPQLVLQIREGAPADVLAAADRENATRVVALGVAAGEPQGFAHNQLTIVTPPGNPAGIAGLADLARDDLIVLLCAPEVPAGRYARRALAAAGVTVHSASDEPSVNAVVSKVGLGEADAGIVYATDAKAHADRVATVPIAPAYQVEATYPIVALSSGRRPAAARAFVAYVRSPQGQATLQDFGFMTP